MTDHRHLQYTTVALHDAGKNPVYISATGRVDEEERRVGGGMGLEEVIMEGWRLGSTCNIYILSIKGHVHSKYTQVAYFMKR